MKSRASLDDLVWLEEKLGELRAGAGPGEQATLVRLQDWLAVAVAARRKQIVGSRTSAHVELVEAYRAADAQWRLACENATNGHGAEVREFRERHPRPTFRAFLLGARKPERGAFCPLCGSPLEDVTLGVRNVPGVKFGGAVDSHVKRA